MPVVAGRSTNLLLRHARLGLARGALVVLALLLFAGGIAQFWLATSDGSPHRDDGLRWILSNYLRPAAETNGIEAEATLALRAGGDATRTGQQQVSNALDDITRVLSLHPMQPRLWLMRARLLQQSAAPARKVSDALKMVYFTSPVLSELTFERLQAGLQLQRIDDQELIEFLRGDVSALLLQRIEQQSRIVEAYRAASPAGKTFISSIVSDLKPDLLSALK